jgi:hypothetical protein
MLSIDPEVSAPAALCCRRRRRRRRGLILHHRPLARSKLSCLSCFVAAAPPPPGIDPADCLSKLPEEIQAQILSCLPAQEAVRMCIVARTWRHVWKFTRRLLITTKSVKEVCEFVGRLLRVRRDGLEVACLDMSEIRLQPIKPLQPIITSSIVRCQVITRSSLSPWYFLSLDCF